MRSLLLILFLTMDIIMSQNLDFENHLYQTYEQFKEKSLINRRFKHSDIVPLINKLLNKNGFNVQQAGKSVQGRSLNLITAGSGKTKIFLWSQMHGDEPTATAALFDIFNFLNADENKDFKSKLFEKVTLYILPMVNPDGAEVFKRRNYYDIDLNRDAVRLQSPEALILKNVFDSVKADFGFNLHDQDHRYSVGNSFRNAAISFLAPAFNEQKDFNNVRQKSVQLIGFLYKVLNNFIPGHIAKYSDDYEPRAFGDNFQKLGTSTVLIESGGWKEDTEKQFIRKLNFITILSAIKSIAEKSYEAESSDVYDSIPFNEKYLFDLMLRNLTVKNGKENIKLDIAINLSELGTDKTGKVFYKSEIADVGDLSIFYGFNDFDLNGYTIEEAQIYNHHTLSIDKLKKVNYTELYSKGFLTVKVKKLPNEIFVDLPLNISLKTNSDSKINVGESANFILRKNSVIEYIVMNGFFHKLNSDRKFNGNGIVLK